MDCKHRYKWIVEPEPDDFAHPTHILVQKTWASEDVSAVKVEIFNSASACTANKLTATLAFITLLVVIIKLIEAVWAVDISKQPLSIAQHAIMDRDRQINAI